MRVEPTRCDVCQFAYSCKTLYLLLAWTGWNIPSRLAAGNSIGLTYWKGYVVKHNYVN